MTRAPFLLALLPAAALAQDHDHDHGDAPVHVHGEGRLHVTVTRAILHTEFTVPGGVLFHDHDDDHDHDHDHGDHETDDHHSAEEAAEVIASRAALFIVPEAAGCQLQDSAVQVFVHEGGDHDGHSDYIFTFTEVCPRLPELASLNLLAFAVLEGLERIQAEIEAPGFTLAAEMTPDRAHVTLRPFVE